MPDGFTISLWRDSDGQGLLIIRNPDGNNTMVKLDLEVVWAHGAKVDWASCGHHPHGDLLNRLGITGGHKKLHQEALKNA